MPSSQVARYTQVASWPLSGWASHQLLAARLVNEIREMVLVKLYA